jgi:CheY-like chemotaxis protein
MKKNVLLVDDDAITNFLNTKTLERMGIARQIHTALNGKEAIDLFNDYYTGTSALPDLVLLDLDMPIMDGFQFLELFQKLRIPNCEKVKIIIVTSSEDLKDIMRAKALGIEHFLLKPVDEECIRRVLID